MTTVSAESLQRPEPGAGLKRAWVVAAAMLLAGAAVIHSVGFFGLILEKTPAPLPFAGAGLAALDRRFKSYEGPTDQYLDPNVAQQLGATSYLLRRYENLNVPAEDPGRRLDLNLNYYAVGSTTAHVPETCWVGSGRVKLRDEFITMPDVHHLDGTSGPMVAHLQSFQALPGEPGYAVDAAGNPLPNLYKNVAYVFQVDGKYAERTDQVSKILWNLRSRYAYHTKIEVTVVKVCTPQEAAKAVGDFLSTAMPRIEACLPDWNALQGVKP